MAFMKPSNSVAEIISSALVSKMPMPNLGITERCFLSMSLMTSQNESLSSRVRISGTLLNLSKAS